VGLSVAREAVAGLQGTLSVRAIAGQGTTITATVPVSILSRRLLLVTFRQQTYALPADCIARVLRVPVKDVITLEGRPAIQFDGTMLPLVPIGAALRAGDAAVTTDKEKACIVVLRNGNGRVGVV